MSVPEVQQFHNDKMKQERERVLLRIANGTKASSPQIISFRHSHPSYEGLPDNSTGSRTMPFFANKDESQCPLEEKIKMRGGTLTSPAGREYARKILLRRAQDDTNQRAAAEGLPRAPPPLMEFSETEQKSLELDQLLNALDDAIDTNDINAINTAINVNQLPKLLITLSPTLTAKQVRFTSAAQGTPDMGDLIQFIDNMKKKMENQFFYNGRNQEAIEDEISRDILEDADEDADEDELNAEFNRRFIALKQKKGSVPRIYALLEDCLIFLKFLASAVAKNLEGKELRTFIGIAAREAFKLNRKEIARNLSVGNQLVEGTPPAPVRRTAAAAEEARPPPLIQVIGEEAPGGAAAAEEEEEEAPVAAAAPAKRWGTYTIDGTVLNMTNEANYQEFRALRESANAQERRNIDAMTRGRIQAGLTKEAAMAYTLERYAPE